MLRRPPPSTGIYIALIVLLAALGALNQFLPQGPLPAALLDQQPPAPRPVMALVTAASLLFVYGGLGFLGLRLSRRLEYPAIWDPNVTHRQRFLIPAYAGGATGAFFIAADALFRRWHGLGPLPHPPFPTSVVASAVAGIGEEVIFRLFFIPFWVWLISSVVLRGRWRTEVFWGIAVVSAIAFALGHLPALMLTLGIEAVGQVPTALLSEIILLNGLLSLLAAYLFRRYGFLAAVGTHFWADVIWHVVWGLIA